MKISDSFKLSVNNIIHRQLRAWLTLLGIVIGVAAVVSIVSIGEGATASVTENLSGLGADILTITPGFNQAGFFGGGRRGPGDFGSSDSGATVESPKLGKLDAVIIRGNPNVLYVNEKVSGRGDIIFVAETISANITGVNPSSWVLISEPELDSGRLLGVSDSSSIVIGYKLANDVFAQPITVGRRVTLEGKAFTVVGILAESDGSTDNTVFMPYRSAWEVTDTEENVYSSIEIKVKDSDLVEKTTEQLTEALLISRRVNDKDQDFTVSSSQAMQAQVNEILGTLTLFLGAIAAVSLIVGAVGVANSMFTSVLEKTREIGIMKALGSTEWEIMQLFMIESALFGFVGGVIGIALGSAVSALMNLLGGSFLGGSSTLVTPELMVIAILLSVGIGVISGILPARSASKLQPVEALRYE